MIDDLSSISEEERCLFRPFTRDSLALIESRIAEEVRRFKELERKRAEGDAVSSQHPNYSHKLFCVIHTNTHTQHCHMFDHIRKKPKKQTIHTQIIPLIINIITRVVIFRHIYIFRCIVVV